MTDDFIDEIVELRIYAESAQDADSTATERDWKDLRRGITTAIH
jgi:hypothetical protein